MSDTDSNVEGQDLAAYILFMNRGRILVLALAVILPVLLFLSFPALARFLILPGDVIARPLSSTEAGAFIVMGTLISWAIWTAAFLLVFALGWSLCKRHRTLTIILAFTLAVTLAFQISGSRNKEFEGIWEQGFEHSDFFVGGNCDRPRYWLRGTEDFYSQVHALGNPTAVRVKFKGTTTRLGSYGHLGQYIREIQV